MEQTYLICFNEPLNGGSFEGAIAVGNRSCVFRAKMISNRQLLVLVKHK